MTETLAVIPARFASTRLPGKPLLDRTGVPLIRHVVEAASRAARVDRVLVATDDRRIADAVAGFGGDAVMTGEHPNGTSRIAEAIDRLDPPPGDDAIVVNVQGDEPELEPDAIDAAVDALRRDPDAPMATLASAFADGEDPVSPHVVKVVTTAGEPLRALYFSRAIIPYVRSESSASNDRTVDEGDKQAAPPRSPLLLKHPGLYAYRAGFLPTYAALPPTPLEQAERLEQLRVLEHGHAIALARFDLHHTGIDTPEQYEAFVKRAGRSRT